MRPFFGERWGLAPAAAAVALVAAVVGGCGGGNGASASSSTSAGAAGTAPGSGGGGESTTTSTAQRGSADKPETEGLSDPQAIRAALEAALASRDPEQACVTYVTDRYVRTAYGSRGGCLQAQRPGSSAKFLRSLNAEVHGARATATTVPVGGPYDGSKLTASLVKEGGSWKVDGLHANVPVGP
jgi:hypothetical protein